MKYFPPDFPVNIFSVAEKNKRLWNNDVILCALTVTEVFYLFDISIWGNHPEHDVRGERPQSEYGPSSIQGWTVK